MTCEHEHKVIEYGGSAYFSASGEWIDTLREQVFCLDCCQYVDEPIEIEVEDEVQS